MQQDHLDEFTWCRALRKGSPSHPGRTYPGLASRATAVSFVVPAWTAVVAADAKPGSKGTPRSETQGERTKEHKISITTPGTRYTCRVYYRSTPSGKVALHAGLLLENEGGFLVQVDDRPDCRYRYLLVHNMPIGIEFELYNDLEYAWLNLASVIRGREEGAPAPHTFLEPIKGETTCRVDVLCRQMDVDLQDPFEIAPRGFLRRVSLLAGKKLGVTWFNSTNCLRFCRRMLNVVRADVRKIDESLLGLWDSTGQESEKQWFPHFTTALEHLPASPDGLQVVNDDDVTSQAETDDTVRANLELDVEDGLARGSGGGTVVDVEETERCLEVYVPNSQHN